MKILRRTENTPTQLDVLRILKKRKMDISSEEKWTHKRLEAGLIGEATVIEYLQKYGQSHWVVLPNVWLKHFGICECDVVLLTSVGLNLFEVKHYTDNFFYENGSCYVNGRKIKNNVVSQTEKARATLGDICRGFSSNIQVNGTLVFTGIDCEVDVRTPVAGVEIIGRNQLKQKILQIIENEEIQQYTKRLPLEKFIQYIDTYRTVDPFLPEPLTKEAVSQLRKGIYCDRCGNYDLLISRSKYIPCRCGYHEPREEAIVRTICEYGVLTHDRGLTKGAVHDFLSGQASHTHVFKLLNKHFVQVKKQKYTYYVNKRLPFDKIRDHFEFHDPKILYID